VTHMTTGRHRRIVTDYPNVWPWNATPSARYIFWRPFGALAAVTVLIAAGIAAATSRPAPAPAANLEPASTQPAAPARTANCVAVPHECGYPDATTTGVPPGTPLSRVPSELTSGRGWSWNPGGWLDVHGDGTVLEGLDVAGNIDVKASGVRISKVRVTLGGDSFGISLRHARDVAIEDTEIAAPHPGTDRLLVGVKDIYGDAAGTQIRRTDISGTATGIQVYSGLIEDSYVHDLGYRSGDHTNGITDNGGAGMPLTIRHNTVLNPFRQTDAIGLFQDFGPQANRVIEGNLLAGGGYVLYAGAKAGAPAPANISIIGNRIARRPFPHGGFYGPVTAFDPSGSRNRFEGNIWDDTGLPVTL
jgi:hypothetical protein